MDIMFMNSKEKNEILVDLKKEYPEGTLVELVEINDKYRQMRVGLRGRTGYIDDNGTIHMHWENGSTLGVAYGIDKIKKVPSDYDLLIQYYFKKDGSYTENNVSIREKSTLKIGVAGIVPKDGSVKVYLGEDEKDDVYVTPEEFNSNFEVTEVNDAYGETIVQYDSFLRPIRISEPDIDVDVQKTNN